MDDLAEPALIIGLSSMDTPPDKLSVAKTSELCAAASTVRRPSFWFKMIPLVARDYSKPYLQSKQVFVYIHHTEDTP